MIMSAVSISPMDRQGSRRKSAGVPGGPAQSQADTIKVTGKQSYLLMQFKQPFALGSLQIQTAKKSGD